MLEPLAITIGAVGAGAGLAAMTSRGHALLAGLRTFAIAAVVSAVVVQLLVEAVATLGGPALLAFVAALAVPVVVGPALRRTRRLAGLDARRIGADVAFYGFVVHQWAEGLALGTVTSAGHDHGHSGLVLGIAAHTVPLTAVFIAATLADRGPRGALTRTIVLAIATAAGFATAGVVEATSLAGLQPWITAVVSGFLVHVLLHGVARPAARGRLSGPLDLLGAVTGAMLPVLVDHGHEGPTGSVAATRAALGEAFVELALETAPMLMLGLAIGAVLQMFGSRIPSRWLSTGTSVRQALRGVAIGARLPLCACGVLPIAEAMRRRGAGPAMVMAFLIATPELGPETLTLTVRFLGWPFAIVRLVAAVTLALLAAIAFSRIAGWTRTESHVHVDAGQSMIVTQGGGAVSRVYAFFDELLLHTAPWTLVGVTAAAYVQIAIPAGSLAALSGVGLDVLVVALVAMPTYVCAAAATPLAAVLLVKGVTPGAVLVGLLLGPATNVATIGVLRRGYGTRAVLLGVATLLVLGVSIGYLVNGLQVPVTLPDDVLGSHGHGPIAWGAALALAVALAAQLWRWGTRPWLAVLDATGHAEAHHLDRDRRPHEHHDHDHDHDHTH